MHIGVVTEAVLVGVEIGRALHSFVYGRPIIVEIGLGAKLLSPPWACLVERERNSWAVGLALHGDIRSIGTHDLGSDSMREGSSWRRALRAGRGGNGGV